MFFLERFFCFHHHEVPHNHDPQDHPGEHDREAQHHAAAADNCHHLRSDSHRLTWSGAAVGLTLHTIIAGIALAAAVEVDFHGGKLAGAAGLGTFLVIVLHKPFDAMTISTLMTVGGWSLAARHLVNGLFALMIPAGVLLFHLGLGRTGTGSYLVPYALAFSAGTFLCISMSDLLPELQFHSHDRGVLSAALLVGLSMAWVIGLVEAESHAGHDHQPGVEAQERGHEHQH
jgi:zinc and cadmium transporter